MPRVALLVHPRLSPRGRLARSGQTDHQVSGHVYARKEGLASQPGRECQALRPGRHRDRFEEEKHG
jgi:hypothetical protein